MESSGLSSTSRQSNSHNSHSNNNNNNNGDARRTLQNTIGVMACGGYESDRRMVKEANISGIIFPWSKGYGVWWSITVVGAIFTLFFEPYQVAFERQPGLSPYTDANSILEYLMMTIFTIDIVVNFNLATYDGDELVYEREQIAAKYFRAMFWVDACGVFPFVTVALAMAGVLGESGRLAVWLSLFRLLRLVRLHRTKELFEVLQYNARVSLFWLTIARNLVAGLLVTHFSACVMYFVARQYKFDEETMLTDLNGEDGFDRYVTSLYWSVVTFTTVGYGDYSPVNAVERIWGMIFMLLNMITCAWIIGSITLLIVKSDEKTGAYRDAVEVLTDYCQMHSFDTKLQKSLQSHLKLEFNNSDVTDEEVLKHFPSAVRRKILRKLYLPALTRTNLMKGVREQFVDAFLATCKVEIFSPGVEILHRGSISSDLYLLVGGIAEIVIRAEEQDSAQQPEQQAQPPPALSGRMLYRQESMVSQHFVLSELNDDDSDSSDDFVPTGRQLETGEFIGEIGFFTESPQIETVQSLTVCKTLTMSKSCYRMMSQEHPGSVGKILQNLLEKVQTSPSYASDLVGSLPKRVDVLRAGSVYDDGEAPSSSLANDVRKSARIVAGGEGGGDGVDNNQESRNAVEDLVRMHMNKLKDDHTTRFLFAASRGDIGTITVMCDQGFDPNCADYDMRTGLMVASMKGNIETVRKILEFGGLPNLVDMHGTSALHEGVKNGHEDVMDLLLSYGAELCIEESQVASQLCQAVFDGDILLLRRLLRAKIPVNISDYDKRTAAHIAAAEGNIAALKVLVEFGADLSLRDRWDNTVDFDAERSKAGQVINFLKEHRRE